jgi:hypothetical protein
MDLGQMLAGTAPAATPAAPPPRPTTGYGNWMLAQSQLPPPPPRQFTVPVSFRPNMTQANKITATPPPPRVPTAPTMPAAPGRVPTTPTAAPVKPISTPFSNYQGKSVGSPSGMMANTPGFAS